MSPVLVGDLRAPSAAEAELDWFFTCADSAMGIQSNWGPLMQAALTGVGAGWDPADMMTDARLEAVHAARVIRERLQRMPRAEAEVLCAAYEARRWPKRVEAVFGRLAGIAVRTTEAQSGFAEAATLRRTAAETVGAWLEETLAYGGLRAIAPVKWAAQCQWVAAIRAYREVRGGGPSVAPKEE